MSSIGPRPGRFRLDPVEYQRMRQFVPRRDAWRCQSCGARSNLEVHHKQFRSHSGDDTGENLITLCTACHNETHNSVTLKWKKQRRLFRRGKVVP